jgi:large subunit ribosomal protein L25
VSETALAVELREGTGKGVARKLRAAGRIPAVLYGQGKDAVNLTIDPRLLDGLLSKLGHNALLDLSGDASVTGRTVLVKEIQRDPVAGSPVHADLFEIDAAQSITVSIPVHVVGIPTGVSLDGGLLDTVLREVEVDCLPQSIPERIDVDVSQLALGDSIHVSDLQLPADVEMKTHGDLAVASVVAPTVEEEPVVEEEEGLEGVEGEAPEAGAEKPAEAAGDAGSGDKK